MSTPRLPTPIIVELDEYDAQLNTLPNSPTEAGDYPSHFQQDQTYYSPPPNAVNPRKRQLSPSIEDDDAVDSKIQKKGDLEDAVDESIRVEHDPKKALMEMEIKMLEEEKERRKEELWQMDIRNKRRKLRKAEEEEVLKKISRTEGML